MRQSSMRRTHTPKLFVYALSAKKHLPSAQITAESEVMNESLQFVAEPAGESGRAAKVVEGFFATGSKLPRLEERFWDGCLQRISGACRCVAGRLGNRRGFKSLWRLLISSRIICKLQ